MLEFKIWLENSQELTEVQTWKDKNGDTYRYKPCPKCEGGMTDLAKPPNPQGWRYKGTIRCEVCDFHLGGGWNWVEKVNGV
jgi:hypothetical protein